MNTINVRCQFDASPMNGWPTRVAEVIAASDNRRVVALSAGLASVETHDNPPMMRENLGRFGAMFADDNEALFAMEETR